MLCFGYVVFTLVPCLVFFSWFTICSCHTLKSLVSNEYALWCGYVLFTVPNFILFVVLQISADMIQSFTEPLQIN